MNAACTITILPSHYFQSSSLPTNSFLYTKGYFSQSGNENNGCWCAWCHVHFVEKLDFHGTWTTLIGTFHQDQIV